MGRAERRRAERRDRIEERKGKILMTRQELRDIRDQCSRDAAHYDVEVLLTCFALAERRLYGFGPKRILRTLAYINELVGETLHGTATFEDFKQQLEEETGVIVRCDK